MIAIELLTELATAGATIRRLSGDRLKIGGKLPPGLGGFSLVLGAEWRTRPLGSCGGDVRFAELLKRHLRSLGLGGIIGEVRYIKFYCCLAWVGQD